MIDKKKIKKLREKGLTYQVIGNMFGVSRQHIHQIIFPEKYKALHRKYHQSDKAKAKRKAYYTENKVRCLKWQKLWRERKKLEIKQNNG